MTHKHNHHALIRAAQKNVADENHILDLSETFRVLSDPTRLKIVMALLKEELCTYDIAQVVGSTESAVSHQLRMLKTLRLVKHRKEGRMAYYSLDDEHIEDLIRIATRHISE